MTRTRTEDDLLEFKRLVRWLTGVTLTQADAEAELAALEAKYAPELATGWIRWTGGKNPVPGKSVLVTLWPDLVGTEARPSDTLRWKHTTDRTGDIVAYRVVAP